jgi:hypothetical protein
MPLAMVPLGWPRPLRHPWGRNVAQVTHHWSTYPRVPWLPNLRHCARCKCMSTSGNDPLLTTSQVCADLGIHRNTLRNWRLAGVAPRMITLPNSSLRSRQSWLYVSVHARKQDAA